MKRVFETAECEEVGNFVFLVQRYEKHENCAVERKVSDWQMSMRTSRACDTVIDRRGILDDRYAML